MNASEYSESDSRREDDNTIQTEIDSQENRSQRADLPASQLDTMNGPLMMPGATPPSTVPEAASNAFFMAGSTIVTSGGGQGMNSASMEGTSDVFPIGSPANIGATMFSADQSNMSQLDESMLEGPTSRPVAAAPALRRRGAEDDLSLAESHPFRAADPRRLAEEEAGGGESSRVRVIWGTNIVISEAMSSFRSFLDSFTAAHRKMWEARQKQEEGMHDEEFAMPSITAMDVEPLYPRLLQQIRDTELYNLNLDVANLRAFPATARLAQQLQHYPSEIVALMDVVVNEAFAARFPAEAQSAAAEPIQVRPFNISSSSNMRSLDPSDIDKLVVVRGLVVRVSNVLPDMRLAYFRCTACGHGHTVENVRGRISEPSHCPRAECHAVMSMELVHNRSLFSDKQLIKLQETPDAIPDGQTPHTVTLCLYDALVDMVRPGDRLQITAIYRSAPVRINPRQRKVRALFRTYLDVLHLQRIDRDRQLAMDVEDEEAAIAQGASSSREDLLVCGGRDKEEAFSPSSLADELHELAKSPHLYERLSEAIAPSVWGLPNVKKGLLLQLCGGISKYLGASSTAASSSNSSKMRFRGDLNILLAGDPGVSKSQLLNYVHKLAPRGIYTSGKGSSAVGLTAYITRDAESGQLVLESGALVLSDGGICCIDEFDKMGEDTRAILHEVMEQQTVSIAKAGIITTLNARTAILASANPVESKYNPARSIVENLNLPPTILSRFDIIFLLLDTIDAEADQRLGRHIVQLYGSSNHSQRNSSQSNNISVPLLARYISHARTLRPHLTDEATRALADGYVAMRKVNGSSAGKTVSATTRQLESLVRLAEAHAKMRYPSPSTEIVLTLGSPSPSRSAT